MKKIILGISIALVIILALFIVDRGGFVTKKMTYAGTLQLENQVAIDQNEYAVLTNNLKYLPVNVLEITPLRIRDFGRYYVGKGIGLGALGMGNTAKSAVNAAASGTRLVLVIPGRLFASINQNSPFSSTKIMSIRP